MDLQLRGKKALVMGSSTGIGRAIAESLIQEGVEVALCARNIEKLKQTASELGCKNYWAWPLFERSHAK